MHNDKKLYSQANAVIWMLRKLVGTTIEPYSCDMRDVDIYVCQNVVDDVRCVTAGARSVTDGPSIDGRTRRYALIGGSIAGRQHCLPASRQPTARPCLWRNVDEPAFTGRRCLIQSSWM